MTSPEVLIAGVGNIFLGDDAFGVEVAQRLMRRPLPDGVRVNDFGICGLDLAYALFDGPATVILIDAAPRGGEPGTLYTIEPDLSALDDRPEASAPDAHGMNPMRVLGLVKSMGRELKRVVVVGCEPAVTGEDEGGQMGLSQPVQAAVGGAVQLIETLLTDLCTVRGKSAIG